MFLFENLIPFKPVRRSLLRNRKNCVQTVSAQSGERKALMSSLNKWKNGQIVLSRYKITVITVIQWNSFLRHHNSLMTSGRLVICVNLPQRMRALFSRSLFVVAAPRNDFKTCTLVRVILFRYSLTQTLNQWLMRTPSCPCLALCNSHHRVHLWMLIRIASAGSLDNRMAGTSHCLKRRKLNGRRIDTSTLRMRILCPIKNNLL